MSRTFETSLNFMPDVILSWQAVKNPQWSGPQLLLFALVESALNDLLRYRHQETVRSQRLFTEAWEWVWREDTTYLFSFINCCYQLYIDPDYIRTGIRAMDLQLLPPLSKEHHTSWTAWAAFRQSRAERRLPAWRGWYAVRRENKMRSYQVGWYDSKEEARAEAQRVMEHYKQADAAA